MIDYIIVGSGLAGIAFAEYALQNNKTIRVFDDAKESSSLVAGGMYNPVVLKRFTSVWKAQEQLDLALPFYREIEKKLTTSFVYPKAILRRFASLEEQNEWFVASDKPLLSNFLDTSIIPNTTKSINAPLGFGKVKSSGYIDTKKFINSYKKYLKQNNLLEESSFDYNALCFENNTLIYNTLQAKNIVFAEGFAMKQNPFFSILPLDGTKGELLYIKAKKMTVNEIIKANIFILPIGNDTYKIGATYNWKDKTTAPTASGKKELLSKLDALLTTPYEVLQHVSGIRPTVNDRRPLVGTHYQYLQVHLLNGLGTRGVMLAPYLAKQLFNKIENNTPLEKEIDITRYYLKLKLYKNKKRL